MFELYQHLCDNEFNRKEQIDNKIGTEILLLPLT